MKRNPIDYIPKKYRKHILIDTFDYCRNGGGKYAWNTYSIVMEWEDGFQRLICEETISDFVWAVKTLEEDREAQW
jgi:hypothetical protein